jgi:hypothetical protein
LNEGCEGGNKRLIFIRSHLAPEVERSDDDREGMKDEHETMGGRVNVD